MSKPKELYPDERDKLKVRQDALDKIAAHIRAALSLLEKEQWEVQQMRDRK